MKKGSVLTPLEIMLVIAVLVVGIVLVVIYLPIKTLSQSCPALQRSDLQDVWNKVNEVKQSPGYQITYLTIRSCTEYIECREEGNALFIKFKDKEKEERFPKDGNWPAPWSCSDVNDRMESLKTYALRIYADRIEVSEVAR